MIFINISIKTELQREIYIVFEVEIFVHEYYFTPRMYMPSLPCGLMIGKRTVPVS